jgi:hypothetical protein
MAKFNLEKELKRLDRLAKKYKFDPEKSPLSGDEILTMLGYLKREDGSYIPPIGRFSGDNSYYPPEYTEPDDGFAAVCM